MVIDRLHAKVLLVDEKHGPAKGWWKMITGLVELGEDIQDAAVREVEEEVGLSDTRCIKMFSIREAHGHVFGLSNLYFVCLIQAHDGASNDVVNFCKREINDAKWISLDEFEKLVDNSLYGAINKHAVDAARGYILDVRTQITGFASHKLSIGRSKKSLQQSLWAPIKQPE